MSTIIDIGTLIERRSGFRRGRPVVAGTGVSVHRIAGWYKLGLSPEEIAENFGHLSLAQVHAALAYYHSNREEIEGCVDDEEAAETRLPERSDSDASSWSIAFPVYFDEDSVNRALIRALRARGMDATNAVDAGHIALRDHAQLAHIHQDPQILPNQ